MYYFKLIPKMKKNMITFDLYLCILLFFCWKVKIKYTVFHVKCTGLKNKFTEFRIHIQMSESILDIF